MNFLNVRMDVKFHCQLLKLDLYEKNKLIIFGAWPWITLVVLASIIWKNCGVSLVNTLIIVWYEVGFSWKTTELEFGSGADDLDFWMKEGSRWTAGIIFTGGWEWTCTIVAEVDGLEDVVDMIPLRGRSASILCWSSFRWPSTMPLVTARTYSISSSRSSSDSEDHGRGC